jgi:hypothetical protein
MIPEVNFARYFCFKKIPIMSIIRDSEKIPENIKKFLRVNPYPIVLLINKKNENFGRRFTEKVF